MKIQKEVLWGQGIVTHFENGQAILNQTDHCPVKLLRCLGGNGRIFLNEVAVDQLKYLETCLDGVLEHWVM
jgi:hypothetical protein